MGEQVIEEHPIYHSWYLKGDYVTARNSRKRPIEVAREEQCKHCPTVRITKIDVNTWWRVGHSRYKYVKGVKIIRVTKEEYLKKEFLATTDLDDVTKTLLK